VPSLDSQEEMRVLGTPIHRYGDAESALQDGMIFGLTTNGTNPDMFILIELRRDKDLERSGITES
jgi:hypothetical protein